MCRIYFTGLIGMIPQVFHGIYTKSWNLYLRVKYFTPAFHGYFVTHEKLPTLQLSCVFHRIKACLLIITKSIIQYGIRLTNYLWNSSYYDFFLLFNQYSSAVAPPPSPTLSACSTTCDSGSRTIGILPNTNKRSVWLDLKLSYAQYST